MEFVETPSFWYPHVDRAACTNFSTETVKLRSSRCREILHFFSFILPFSFLSMNSFFYFFPFCFPFFWITIDHSVKGGNFLLFSSKPLVSSSLLLDLSLFVFKISFIASSHTWLNVSHGIMQHMAQCEPFLSSEPHGSFHVSVP